MAASIRVLIIEDSEPDAELLVRELQQGGYDPDYEIVDTPEGMNAALDKDSWDVIIADYVMPHFSGLDALQMAQDRQPDIPFFIVSGKIGEDIAVETMLAGAQDYILKNNLARLAPAVKREIRDNRRRQRAYEARQEAEEALRRAYDEQEQRIKDRTEELIRANSLLSREITERKRAESEVEQARAESERKAAEFRSFISSMVDGVLVLDENADVVFSNRAGRQILGLQRGEKVSGWLEDYKRFDLAGRPLPLEEMPVYRALHGETVKDMRERLVTPNGKELSLSLSASPIHDAEGQVTGATLVFRDERWRIELEQQQHDLYSREHRIAQVLQSALVPPVTSLDVTGCKIALKYVPGLEEAEVGGDFYDVFELSDDKVGIVIGDVAGKGLSAAVLVAAAKHAIRSYAYIFDSPAKVMKLANESIYRAEPGIQLETNMLTAFFAIVNPKKGLMTYTNAGHEPPVIKHADGRIEELNNANTALGVFVDSEYTESSHVLEPDDTVVMTTDGITEARTSGAFLFGKEGIVKYLSDIGDIPLTDIPYGLLEAARTFGGGRLQDDAAIVVFQCS